MPDCLALAWGQWQWPVAHTYSTFNTGACRGMLSMLPSEAKTLSHPLTACTVPHAAATPHTLKRRHTYNMRESHNTCTAIAYACGLQHMHNWAHRNTSMPAHQLPHLSTCLSITCPASRQPCGPTTQRNTRQQQPGDDTPAAATSTGASHWVLCQAPGVCP